MSESLQYLTDEHGERTAVVLPISEYEKLLQDLEDLAVVAERRNESTTRMRSSIQWRESTKKDLRAIPAHEVERIVAAVEKLSDEPFPYGFQKLTGAAHTYRIRIGDYRVVYEVLVESKIVEIARVRHRKDVYR